MSDGGDFSVALIIPAAGSSTRYSENSGGAGARSKLDEDLGGRPVLQRTIELFNKRPDVVYIVVAGPADDESFAEFHLRHADKLSLLGAVLTKGGLQSRAESVLNALKLVPESATHIAVHDAARPCASQELIDRVFDAARTSGFDGVVPGIDVPDTLKRVSPEFVENKAHDPLAAILGEDTERKKLGRPVVETQSRENIVAAQTPQVFRAHAFRKAYAGALAATDDAQLVEKSGGSVLVVPGEPTNIKITRPADIRLVRAILGLRAPEERAAHKRF